MNVRRLHTDRAFEAQLEAVRNRLIMMAGRVEEMIASAVKALVERDTALAESTIAQDAKVNQTEVALDEQCMRIIARWQPMGRDLRFITLTFKMVTDLERIGDLAVNICERAIDLAPEPPLKPWIDIPAMTDLVQSMVHDAIDAFVASDAAKAQEVILRDDRVDELYNHVFREIVEIMLSETATVERAIHALSVAKWLERIGDHGTNLAEQVVFLVQGRDVRHPDKTALS